MNEETCFEYWGKVGTEFIREPVFMGTRKPLYCYHLCLYLANRSPSYDWLIERNLVTSEDNVFQYRFQKIVDPETDQMLYEIEHEVRSLHHPMFMRSLVNRWKEKPLP